MKKEGIIDQIIHLYSLWPDRCAPCTDGLDYHKPIEDAAHAGNLDETCKDISLYWETDAPRGCSQCWLLSGEFKIEEQQLLAGVTNYHSISSNHEYIPARYVPDGVLSNALSILQNGTK